MTMKAASIARAFPKILSVKLGSKIPVRTTACITYRCNLDCSYCSRHFESPDELDTTQWKDLMSSFHSAGTVFWSFNGGEPLMRRDLGQLIRHGKDLGLYMSLATNATLIAENIDLVKDADMVSISLDGPKDVQDKMRPKSFELAVKGLEALSDLGINTAVTCVVGSHNVERLDDLLCLCSTYGAKAIFQPIRIQKEDDSGASGKYFPTRQKMRQAMDYLIERKRSGAPISSTTAYLTQIRDYWPDKMPAVGCWGGRMFCFIDPRGYVTSCCDTLIHCGHTSCSGLEYGAKSFDSIPGYACDSCFSSMPLEANLFMDSFPLVWDHLGF
jgi:pyrroloquinoline quinone biosynthesis protein E